MEDTRQVDVNTCGPMVAHHEAASVRYLIGEFNVAVAQRFLGYIRFIENFTIHRNISLVVNVHPVSGVGDDSLHQNTVIIIESDDIAGKGWKEDLAAAVVSIGVDLAVLYIVGAFSVHTSMEDTGLGVYSANVNSLINPVIFSRFLPGLPYGEGQLEGFGYLGLGVLILTAGTVILAIYGVYKNREKDGRGKRFTGEERTQRHARSGNQCNDCFSVGFPPGV